MPNRARYHFEKLCQDFFQLFLRRSYHFKIVCQYKNRYTYDQYSSEQMNKKMPSPSEDSEGFEFNP